MTGVVAESDVAVLSADDARRLTDQIKVGVEAVWELIVQAYEGRAWSALGHGSWDDYCVREFGTARLRLPFEDRREVVYSLRDAGLSIRSIAAATGSSTRTVQRDLAGVVQDHTSIEETTADEVTRAKVTGADGKSYPASKPAMAMASDDQIEHLRARLASELGGEELFVRRFGPWEKLPAAKVTAGHEWIDDYLADLAAAEADPVVTDDEVAEVRDLVLSLSGDEQRRFQGEHGAAPGGLRRSQLESATRWARDAYYMAETAGDDAVDLAGEGSSLPVPVADGESAPGGSSLLFPSATVEPGGGPDAGSPASPSDPAGPDGVDVDGEGSGGPESARPTPPGSSYEHDEEAYDRTARSETRRTPSQKRTDYRVRYDRVRGEILEIIEVLDQHVLADPQGIEPHLAWLAKNAPAELEATRRDVWAAKRKLDRLALTVGEPKVGGL